MRPRRKFEVDRHEAKLMGVCAGIGRHFGVDPTVIRIGFVVATVLGGWPWTLVAYIVLGVVGQPKRVRARTADAASTRPDPAFESSERMRDFDRRLAEIDSHIASSNSRLEREIDDLR